MLACRDEKDLVVHLDDGVAARGNRLATAKNGSNTGIGAGDVLPQLTQLVPDQRPPVVGTHGDQLHPPAGKIQHLQRTGIRDQALDVFRYQLLGADKHIDRHRILGKQARVVQVIDRTHPRDLGGGMEQGIGDLAGNHIGFVTVGHSQNHVGIIGTGRCQCFRIGGSTDQCADIQPVLQILQYRGIVIDHGYVIGLAGEVCCNRRTDLAGAEDDDLHESVQVYCNPSGRECHRAHSAPFL